MRIELVRAWPHRYERAQVTLTLPHPCIHDAMHMAGWALDQEFVGYAIFGQTANATTLLHDGDRIELMRGLHCDPKQARRRRAQQSATTKQRRT
jgi:uncharacterized protein